MIFKIIFLILLTRLSYGQESTTCLAYLSHFETSTYFYTICEQDKMGCKSFENHTRTKQYWLRVEPRMPLKLLNAAVQNEGDINSVAIEFDDNTKCLLQKFSVENKHKRVALVSNDRVVFENKIDTVPFTNGLTIALGKPTSFEQAVEVCQAMYPACKSENAKRIWLKSFLSDILNTMKSWLP